MVYYVGGTNMICALISLYFIEVAWACILATFFIGLSLAIPYVIPYSMLPDVIEEDEKATGKRREGIFFGFFTIFLKLAVTCAITLTNLALAAAGYEKPTSSCGGGEEDADGNVLPDSQPDAVIKVMRIMIGPAPACFFALAMYFTYLFPINKETHNKNAKEVLRERERRKTVYLEGQKKELNVTDQLTGGGGMTGIMEDEEENAI